MNFDLGEKDKALCEKVEGLFQPHDRAALSRLETGGRDEVRDMLLQCLSRLSETGALEIGLKGDGERVTLVSVQEALATISPSLFLSAEMSTRVFGRLIASFGTEEQRALILPALKTGRIIGAVSIVEDNMGMENNPLQTTAVKRGDQFEMSGSKGPVINAPVADWIAVAANFEEETAFFLVDKDNDGLRVGQRKPTLGFGGASIAGLTLEACPVPGEFVIGPFERKEPFRSIRIWEDQVLTAAGLGLMQRCFEAAKTHAKRHKSGGKPIIAYQEVSFKLAEMLTLLQTSRLLAFRTAWMSDTSDREREILTRCAKVFCAESAEEVASKALQILGGQGYFKGNPAEEGYRDSKYLQIAGTSSEISRMKIADDLLHMD